MRIVEVFASIQGEGVLAGTPMYFIRFAGCNLRCAGCDTPKSHEPSEKVWELREVIDQLSATGYPDGIRYACFTGGEPTLQWEAWSDLMQWLRSRNIEIALETNGTQWLPAGVLSCFSWIVVSPKTAIATLPLIPFANEIKFVYGINNLYRTPEQIQRAMEFVHSLNVYPTHKYAFTVQPWLTGEAEPDAQRTREVFELAQRLGVRMSVQLHKMIGVR